MKKAFKMAENIVKLNVAMVIDDIYTTGSTMDAMSACLLEAGFKEIYCMSVLKILLLKLNYYLTQ